MIRKGLFFIFVIIFLTGCDHYNDIGNIAVVSSLGITIQGPNYKTYVKVLSSNSENEENIYTESCSDLDECFNNLNTQLMKRLYLTHMDLLILSNNLTKENYDHIFNFFLNQQTSRNSFSTIVVDKINNKILHADSMDINNMLSLSAGTNALASRVSLSDIIKDVLNFRISYIPYIETGDFVTIKGYKTVYDENKLLNKEESIAVNLLKGKVKNFSVLIDKNTYHLEECNVINKVDGNFIGVDVSCNYHGDKEEDIPIIEKYLEKGMKSFIDNNNQNYLKYLIYKYENRQVDVINYKVNININYKEKTGGDIFE